MIARNVPAQLHSKAREAWCYTALHKRIYDSIAQDSGPVHCMISVRLAAVEVKN
jgi:hypothetical protein